MCGLPRAAERGGDLGGGGALLELRAGGDGDGDDLRSGEVDVLTGRRGDAARCGRIAAASRPGGADYKEGQSGWNRDQGGFIQDCGEHLTDSFND